MPIDKIELTKEQVAKAMACKTAEELMAMARLRKLWPVRPQRSLWQWQKPRVLN